MSTEITRLAEGTRVIRGNGTTRGTVAGYHRSSLVVTVDGGGTDSSPAAHRAWRELTAEEQAEEQQLAKERLLGDAATVAAQQGFPPVASHNGEASTDLLRAAAQGMAAQLYRRKGYTQVACTSGCHSLTVTPYLFDERGRMDERALWALVEILEHVIERGPRHNLTTWVVGA